MGKISVTAVLSTLIIAVATPALAGAINAPLPAMTNVQASPANNTPWSGFYAGGSLGFESLTRFQSFSTDPNVQLFNPSQWLNATSFGGFAGYNFQSANLVYGGELAISSGGIAATSVGFDYAKFETTFDLKARAGFSFGDVLAYGVIGGSFSNLRFVNGANIPSAGFNYGAGIEYKLNEHLFIGAEYLVRTLTGVHDLNSAISATSTLQSAQFRVGWKF